MVGAVLLIIVLSIICLVIVTEKSFVGGVKTGSRRVYESAREDAIARKERARQRRQEQESRRAQEAKEREEEEARRDAEKILRMDKKVFGVMPDVTLSEDTRTAGAENTPGTSGGIRDIRASAPAEKERRTGRNGDSIKQDNLIDFERIRIHSAVLGEEDEKTEHPPSRSVEEAAPSLEKSGERSADPLARTYRNADVFRDMRMMEPLRITVEPVSSLASEEEMQEELQKRVADAGIEIIDVRLNQIAYAPEIAAAMLQRQQATAIIAARRKIVEGAVSMVEMALDRLKTDGVVDLDDERRAQMVGNLMVVLCSNREANPVVNAGSIY